MDKFFAGFRYAINGIKVALKEERNMRIHLAVAINLFVIGYPFGLSRADYIALTITVALVMSLEAINSSIERVVDYISADRHPLAGVAKDMAAGAVLIFSIAAVIVAFFVFCDGEKIIRALNFYKTNLLYVVVTLVCLASSFFLAFKGE